MSKAGQLARLLNHIDDGYARCDGSSLTGALVLSGAGVDPAHSADAGSAGGGGAHNNMQPSLAVNFIIKT